jgi:hypothetical protein
MNELKYLEVHGDRVVYRDAGAGEAPAVDSWHGGKFSDVAGGLSAAVEEIPRAGLRDIVRSLSE